MDPTQRVRAFVVAGCLASCCGSCGGEERWSHRPEFPLAGTADSKTGVSLARDECGRVCETEQLDRCSLRVGAEKQLLLWCERGAQNLGDRKAGDPCAPGDAPPSAKSCQIVPEGDKLVVRWVYIGATSGWYEPNKFTYGKLSCTELCGRYASACTVKPELTGPTVDCTYRDGE